jgi:FlaA1/EpsC-like NDP-sugar epimerase
MKLRLNLDSPVCQTVLDGCLYFASAGSAALLSQMAIPMAAQAFPFLLWMVALSATRVSVNAGFRVYRFLWKLVGLTDAIHVAIALGSVTVALLAIHAWFPARLGSSVWLKAPVVFLALEFYLSLTLSLGVRVARRLLHELSEKESRREAGAPRRVLLYGAGRAGILLYKELKGNGDFQIVGFLDDDPAKKGTFILGKPVLGNRVSLEEILQKYHIDELVISIAGGHPRILGEIVQRCQKERVASKIIPSLQEIVEGKAPIGQLRTVSIEDLFGRDSGTQRLSDVSVAASYERKRILITGAGGSIGSELARQLMLIRPSQLVLLDKDEGALYELEQEVRPRFPDLPIETTVADIRHSRRVRAIFDEFRPEIVFHAAAHKHVPLMERQPCEALLNNVGGTRMLLDQCCASQVQKFIFISTDKAVNPTSVMGATKRVCEMLVRRHAVEKGGDATCVRFGNVAGSRGSVIPLLKQQILQGGPITITHPDIVRFFMTIPEAVQLVLAAGTLGKQGEVFVLDMGDARNILELAHTLITLSGLQPGRNLPIQITGLRPGEKMYEELAEASETFCSTSFERISLLQNAFSFPANFLEEVDRLLRLASENETSAALAAMGEICPAYQPAIRVSVSAA